MNKLMSVAVAASLAITVLGAASLQNARAEQVKVPVGTQGDRGKTSMPDTGQSRETVRQRFGDPASTSGPVGDPPITQWHYDDFVVYFENNHVIHTVARHSR